MVTSLVEAGRQKCHLYYPHIVGRSHTYQEFTVNCYKVDDEDDWVVTFLRLTNTKTSGAVSAELFRLFFSFLFLPFSLLFLDIIFCSRRKVFRSALILLICLPSHIASSQWVLSDIATFRSRLVPHTRCDCVFVYLARSCGVYPLLTYSSHHSLANAAERVGSPAVQGVARPRRPF